MKRLLAKASCVATLDDTLGTITRGAILVEEETIAAVGPYDEISRLGPFDEEVGSLDDDLLMPGLTSAHHHSGRVFRDGIAEQPLECWAPFLHGDYRSDYTPEDLYLNTAWSCIELLRNGCTSTVDHQFAVWNQERLGIPLIAQTYSTIGMRVGLCVQIADQNRFYYEGDGEVLSRLPAEAREAISRLLRPRDLNRFFEIWDSFFNDVHEPRGRVRIFLGPSGPNWCSEGLLRRVKESTQRRKTGIQIHLLETAYQRVSGPRTKGKSMVKWLDEMGFWGPEVSCAHSVWVSEEDLTILRNRGATVVHNPANNLRLSSGIAPIRVMKEMGVPLAFGADGCGMNDDNDLFMDLRLGHLLQRLPGFSFLPISSEDWFKMAVRGGARALLQSDTLGSLAPGKKADFILVDMRRLRHPCVNPDIEPLSLLLQRGLGRDVHAVFVDGQSIMRDRKILTIDEEAVAAGIKRTMERHYPRLRALRPLYRQLEAEIRDLYGGWDLCLPGKSRYQYNVH